jgi:hypothetical protein
MIMILSASDLPSFPNNNDIRHSASLGINYDINTNLKALCGGIWRNGQPIQPLQGEETVQIGNTMTVNYDSPNNKNLDTSCGWMHH